jgi:hypothetical protein
MTGGYLSVNYIVEILHIIEYEELDGLAGYQRGEELFIFGNSTGKEAVWDSWNVLSTCVVSLAVCRVVLCVP